MSTEPSPKLFSPSAERNQEHILDVLRDVLTAPVRVLEIASGTGQHAVHFAAGLPHVWWQPTDADPRLVHSIAAYVRDAGLTNLAAPLVYDVNDPWPVEAGAVVCINMVHIAPWGCCEALFRGAGEHLARGGKLITYGPYRFDGDFTAASNVAFDRSLRLQNPAWGVRDVTDLDRLAKRHGLARSACVAMPVNNHTLVFEKQ